MRRNEFAEDENAGPMIDTVETGKREHFPSSSFELVALVTGIVGWRAARAAPTVFSDIASARRCGHVSTTPPNLYGE
jgi:hypothetical protein